MESQQAPSGGENQAASTSLVPYKNASPEERAAVEPLLAEINPRDSNSIIFFGTKAQQDVTSIADEMLNKVRNKDLGAAGDVLSDMVGVLRGFHTDDVRPGNRPGFMAKLFGRANPVAKLFQRYEDVRKQIDAITDRLEGHKTTLLTDVAMLDRLYEATLGYFRQLERYVMAGEEKLRQLDEELIPALAAEYDRGGNVLKSQELRDLRAMRDDLERRVHDLRLTRQVAMQSLPSIRLVQENDKGLVNKINSTLINTVPLWRQQLATAVAVFHSGEAAETVKSASDLTNELLEKNAENLQIANAAARRQMEAGVFDVESVQRANDRLIATIEESLQIADEGKRRRAEAVRRMEAMEQELKQSLIAASGRPSQAEPPAPPQRR